MRRFSCSRGLVLPTVLIASAWVACAEPNLLDVGYQQMYNLQFAEAHESFSQWQRLHPDDPDARFAAVLCHGLRSDYMALIEKRYMPSFKEMKAARGLAEQLLEKHPEYYDAWIAVGLENYMLSIKPAPIRWLLRLTGGKTDGQLGLEKLQITAEKGHYLKPFARLLLAVAALREHDTDRARDILEDLAKKFPHNPLYVQELARL